MRVWITRAQPGADATAVRLRARGHAPLVAPLLTVEPIAGAALPLEGVAALAFTSANAVRAFAALAPETGRETPVHAVGEATAQAARAAGFSDVRSADGDVEALADKLATEPPSGLLLHLCAETPAGDLAGALRRAGIAARAVPIYRTVAVEALPAEAYAKLAAEALDAVLLHSPRAASALARLAAGRLARLRLFGLSDACLAPLAGEACAGRASASRPQEDVLLDLLG